MNQAVKTASEAELNCCAVHSLPKMTGSTMQTEVRYMIHSTTLMPSARYCVEKVVVVVVMVVVVVEVMWLVD